MNENTKRQVYVFATGRLLLSRKGNEVKECLVNELPSVIKRREVKEVPIGL